VNRNDEEREAKRKKKSQIKRDVAKGAEAISCKKRVLRQHRMNNKHR